MIIGVREKIDKSVNRYKIENEGIRLKFKKANKIIILQFAT